MMLPPSLSSLLLLLLPPLRLVPFHLVELLYLQSEFFGVCMCYSFTIVNNGRGIDEGNVFLICIRQVEWKLENANIVFSFKT